MNYNMQLEHVEYMPKELKPWTLYVSKRFNVAAHLCPCGCSSKVVTPIGPCEWSYSEKNGKPTLYPSIGNWQIPCKSHYWITNGEIKWADQWTEQQIKAGYERERQQREEYYREKTLQLKKSLWQVFVEWVKRAIKKLFR